MFALSPRVARAAWAVIVTAAAAIAVVDAASADSASSGGFRYLIFSDRCFESFFTHGDLLNIACLKQTISKTLGYGIIAGACIVKVPQIINFLRAGSVAGVSRESVYLELLGYLVSAVYHIVQGNPFSAYGETVIITAQSLVITAMLWAYDTPGTAHMLGVSAGLAALTQAAYVAPKEYRPSMQYGSTLLFTVARAWQVAANYKQGGTGQLAFLTLFMNFAGSAARIFTSSQEVKEVEVLVSFVISTALNAALLGQYVYYNVIAKRRGSSAGRGAGAAASGGKRKAAAATQVTAPAPAAEAPPSSGGRRSGRGATKRD